MFTVYAENESGAARATVSIQVRKGRCAAEGVFPVTSVGDTAVYECSSQGNYVGTQKRTCILGSEDGEWQKASGFCLSVPLLAGGVLIVIVIIVVIVLFLMRTGKKTKAKGGVRGKKSMKSTKTTSKKPSTKQVKV